MHGTLPQAPQQARRLAAQESIFTVIDNILYFIDPKCDDRRRCAVPTHLRVGLMEENHSGPMSGHFSADKALVHRWWWPRMYSEVVSHCSNCTQCAIVNSSRRVNRPPLNPIPVERVFQIIGVDIMDLPKTNAGNKHVVVFGLSIQVPLVFPVPDQKTSRIVKLLVEELVPHFGVPEALFSDRGTNLLCKTSANYWASTSSQPRHTIRNVMSWLSG